VKSREKVDKIDAKVRLKTAIKSVVHYVWFKLGLKLIEKNNRLIATL